MTSTLGLALGFGFEFGLAIGWFGVHGVFRMSMVDCALREGCCSLKEGKTGGVRNFFYTRAIVRRRTRNIFVLRLLGDAHWLKVAGDAPWLKVAS